MTAPCRSFHKRSFSADQIRQTPYLDPRACAQPHPDCLVRIHWQVKALLPVAFVLLNGLLLFLLATLSLRDPERHTC